jgi:hypothetical protein
MKGATSLTTREDMARVSIYVAAMDPKAGADNALCLWNRTQVRTVKCRISERRWRFSGTTALATRTLVLSTMLSQCVSGKVTLRDCEEGCLDGSLQIRMLEGAGLEKR